MLREFRQFLFRGNLIDLAVAIVIGTAFGLLVTAFVADIITPIVAAIFGQPDFSGMTFTINDSVFEYGDFLNALITFMLDRRRGVLLRGQADECDHRAARPSPPTDEIAMRECPECLSSIPGAAHRCSACTSGGQPVS